MTCSLSSKISAKEYSEKYHFREVGDKLWQWALDAMQPYASCIPAQ